MHFKDRDLISINDLSKEEILFLLDQAKKVEAFSHAKRFGLLQGKIMASLFFEPSTRTRLSFSSSMEGLGGRVIGFDDEKTTSVKKGESLFDTIKMVEQYADVIVMRHPRDGAARLAAEASSKPIINAGDGANQHPTQTLLDLFSILKTQGKLEGLNIAMVGDLKYGRTVHSLAMALSHFDCNLFFVAPPMLRMPKQYLDELRRKGMTVSEHEKMEDVLGKVDVLYMTRIQQERFPDPADYEKVKHVYRLTRKGLTNVKPNLKIMHPLPRINEISTLVDETPYAYYFQQAGNGIPVRQALILQIMGVQL
ncbi:aspartate carbamoyltransferase [Candidatus Woesearchaeota archaeon]|nr:aspartate carbamoyltransferase [Candidatus Woesearchaeota archaeon]